MLCDEYAQLLERKRLLYREAHEELAAARFHSSKWAAVGAVSMQHRSIVLLPLVATEVALALVQMQAATSPPPTVWLCTAGAQLAGSSAAHAGLWGVAFAELVGAKPIGLYFVSCGVLLCGVGLEAWASK